MPTLGRKIRRVTRTRGVGYVILLAFLIGGATFNSVRMDRDQARLLETACRRGNVVRGYLLLRAREFTRTQDGGLSRTTELAPVLFPLVDCGTGRPMAPVLAEQYLQLLAQGRPPR